MCIFYTSLIAYRGTDRLDTTVKSGAGLGRLLAPTWTLVGGIKHWNGYTPLTHEQYIDQYYTLLRARYKADPTPFFQLLERDQLVICCYCTVGTFCHRHFAVDILSKIAAAKGHPFKYGGELPVC